ncbi:MULTISPECIES: hypothetical protein [Planktothrix]|uniref:hypothetical protein n=1 Tax=Planktothrix TaxID=54304 RepID=UPI00047875F9|nr:MULTISPECIES: hypothetical protein [Planktothrix]
MAKSLQDNLANPLFLHDKFNMERIIGLYLNFKMKLVVEFNLTNPSADGLGVDPQLVFLNNTGWG